VPADLSRISLFQGMKPEALRALSERTAVRSVPADAVLMEQGDPAGALYAVLRGRVKIYVHGPDGQEHVLDVRGPGQYVGEMALDGSPRSASVKAIEPCEVAEIPRDELAGLLQQNPDVALHMIKNLIRLARGLNLKTIEDVKTRSELQLYIEQLKSRRGEDLPSVKRWVAAKRWVLVALLVFAVGQYYFLDVLLEMMSMGGGVTTTAERISPGRR
jgi:CRP-like cAMP-binding protein